VTRARPAVILFDWDNTLVDNWASVRAALNAALVAFGMAPWSEAETRRRVRRSLRESFPELFGVDWKRAREIFYRTFEAEHLNTLRPMPGAAAALAEFAAGATLGVVSNKQGRLLRLEADALGWTGHFRRLVGATDAPRDKPDPAPIRLALDSLPAPTPETVWYVGDTALDMQTAHGAGCRPVLFGKTEEDQDLLTRFPPSFEVADFAEMVEIWRGLQSARK